jgi:hypothetical protein
MEAARERLDAAWARAFGIVRSMTRSVPMRALTAHEAAKSRRSLSSRRDEVTACGCMIPSSEISGLLSRSLVGRRMRAGAGTCGCVLSIGWAQQKLRKRARFFIKNADNRGVR